VNALLDQTKSEQWPVGASGWCDKVRMQPMLAEILDDARPATIGKGDQLLHGALLVALITAMINGRLRWVYDTLGKILGLDAPAGKSLPNGEVSEPDASQNGARRPLARVAR